MHGSGYQRMTYEVHVSCLIHSTLHVHFLLLFLSKIMFWIIGLGIDESNPVKLAWRLLEVTLNSCEEDMQTVIHKAVSSRLLALGVFLPNWLVSSYKVMYQKLPSAFMFLFSELPFHNFLSLFREGTFLNF